MTIRGADRGSHRLRAETALAPGAMAAETVAPPTPDIGDVALGYTGDATFVMPDFSDEFATSPDENIGDIGDPRDITREADRR